MSLLTIPGFGEVLLTRAEEVSEPIGDFARAFSGKARSDSRPYARSWRCQTAELAVADAKALRAALTAPRVFSECTGDFFDPLASNDLRFRSPSLSYLTDSYAVVTFEAHEVDPLAALLRWESGYPVAGTFARTSTAYQTNALGRLESVASGVARVGHYVTDAVTGLTVPGWLLEPAGTNLLLRSQEFDNASWTKSSSASVGANAATAPDGTATADTLTDANGAGVSYVERATTVANDSVARTFSVYLKKTTGTPANYPSVGMGYTGGTLAAAELVVDTTNGTGTWRTSLSGDRYYIADTGDYWRVEITKTNNSTGNTSLNCFIAPAFNTTGTGTIAAAATGSVVAWGAQLETGSLATSYIATTTASVARAVDILSRTLPSGVSLPTDAHARYTRWIAGMAGNGGLSSPRIWSTGDGTVTASEAFARLYWNASDSLTFTHSNGSTAGGDNATLSGLSVPRGATLDSLVRTWMEDGVLKGDFSLYVNGVSAGTATLSGITPASAWNGGAVTYINSRDGGNNAGAMTLLRDFFIPRRLTGDASELLDFCRQF